MMIVEVVADEASKAKFDPALNIGPKLQAATRERGLIVRKRGDLLPDRGRVGRVWRGGALAGGGVLEHGDHDSD